MSDSCVAANIFILEYFIIMRVKKIAPRLARDMRCYGGFIVSTI
jgi:hypothetical protein